MSPKKDTYIKEDANAFSVSDDAWQRQWEELSVDVVDAEGAKKPFYNLMMFPYPSAEGLHVGNMYAFTGSDMYGRYKRMNGYGVFEPIGLDGFGIHSENYSIKVGRHPMDHARITEKNFYAQLRKIGAMYDWTKTVETYKSNYYRFTQWLFVKLFQEGLVYRSKAMVNWCPGCNTVIADEQVIDGLCERCGNKVEKRNLEQWFFKITAYADRLDKNLSTLDWSSKVVHSQKNWIGKKEGIAITYQIVDEQGKKVDEISCFTTRPDTNFGATFVVVAPEHNIVNRLLPLIREKYAVRIRKYIEITQKRTQEERMGDQKEKTGEFTGLYCTNQLTGERMPLYIADYVILTYGTGAVIGVPGHDKRDFAFAKQFNIQVKRVVASGATSRSVLMGGQNISDNELTKIGVEIKQRSDSGTRFLEIPQASVEAYKGIIRKKLTGGFWNEIVGKDIWFLFKEKDQKVYEYILSYQNMSEIAKKCSAYSGDLIDRTSNLYLYLAENPWYEPVLIQEEEGSMINSDFLNGLDIHKACEKMMHHLEKEGWGKRINTYHLRDWLISRQRYWGPPIPMINCEQCAKDGKSWFTSKEAKDIERNKNLSFDIQRNSMIGWYPVSEDNLPVELPFVEDFKPGADGIAPLAKHKEFYETTCPGCGGKAVRETDVSDTFLDSSWYFLRYPSVAKNSKSEILNPKQNSTELKTSSNAEFRALNFNLPWNPELTKKWLPVDMYSGGAEHSVLHLLYARFITMALYDMGYLHFEEPFTRFFAHGLVIKNGAKMSKSKGNVVNPDEYIDAYGADALRMYLMFMGPYADGGDFRDTAMEGMFKWVGRIRRIVEKAQNNTTSDPEIETLLHKTIKKVGEDIEKRQYNTAIAAMMEFTNFTASQSFALSAENLKKFLLILAPFAPFLTDKAWQVLAGRNQLVRKEDSIHFQPWPAYDQERIVESTVTIAVQVNGKLRDTIMLGVGEAGRESVVVEKAQKLPNVERYLKDQNIKKVIFVHQKLVNFVVAS